MRWLFHVVRAEELARATQAWGAERRYAPPSLAREGFVHCSYRDAVAESARLYFGGAAPGALAVLAVDPRRLDAPVEIAETPRGEMPHVRGPIPEDAVRVLGLGDVGAHADRVSGTRIGFLAFEGMTLLDLVGPLDALSRIASMGFDTQSSCEVVALTPGETVWAACGLAVRAARYRPPLEGYDVLVVPGGPGTRALEGDPEAMAYLASFPKNRLVASVCTGALLLGAAGRLRGVRATTHHTALGALARHGAHAVRRRVVDELQIVTAAGVTAGIDLGLHLVRRLTDEATAAAVGRQMEVSGRDRPR
jgi:cyclohexyl-isocyanide hydratase